MIAKAVFLFCAQAFLAQYINCQCIAAPYNDLGVEAPWGVAGPWNGLPYGVEAPLAASWAATPYATAEWATGYGPGFVPSNGGGFAIRSVSPIAVTGVSITSENIYEGPLSVSGAMPFLGAVSLEGALPTIGAGAVAYGCGNGNIAMLSEDITPGLNAYGPYGPGVVAPEFGYGYGGPIGYEAGFVGPAFDYGYNIGCGCGAVY